MARPREFDEEAVLDRALHVFWDKGYEGASLSDLLEAMGLTKSSLYKAFGSKEQLFRRAVDRYRRDHLGFRRAALDEASPRAIAEHLLYGAADLHTGACTPRGCCETNGALGSSVEGAPIRAGLLEDRACFAERLRDRFETTRTARSLPAGMSSADVANLVVTLMQGMAVQARAGATRETLRAVARTALLPWGEA